MKDLVERGLVFVRDVTSFFEKADGERRNCPRCSGSGLLKPRRIWHWNSRSVGNDPCWFCEGVGVMPLFGLNGFILGRATAVVNTDKQRESVNPPFPIHLCLGKYPGSKSKFNSYSPTQNMSSLLYEPGNVPVWVTDAVEEIALQGSEDSKMAGAEVGNFSIPGLLPGTKSLQGFALRSAASAPSSSSSIDGLLTTKTLVSNGDDTQRLHNSATFSDVDLRPQSTGGKHRHSAGGRYRIRMTRQAQYTWNAPMVSTFRQRINERAKISEAKEIHEMDPGLLSIASGAHLIPRIFTSNGIRRVKSAKRRRNHIREKMERETIQDTWRLRRLLYPRTEESTTQGPSDALQTFGGSWKDLSKKCLAELTASSRPPNKPRFSQLGPTAPYPSLVNQPFYGKLVGKLQLLPNGTKPLKW